MFLDTLHRVTSPYGELHALIRAGRVSDEVRFVVPLAEEEDLEPARNVQASADRALRDLGDVDLEVKAEPAALGRGASGEAIAFVVFVGVPAARDWWDWAKSVAYLWKRIRERRGQRPSLSLGAARTLCGAHLSGHLGGDVEGVHFIGAGDVGPRANEDFDHTGGDLFCVIFGRGHRTWIYVIDSTGGIVSFAEGSAVPWLVGAYVTGEGFDFEQLPEELPPIIGDENDEKPML